MALPIEYNTGVLTHPALKKGDLTVGIGSVEYGPTGIFKRALEFDGTDDYVDCGIINEVRNTSKLTVSVWVKPVSITSTLYSVVGNYSYTPRQAGWNVSLQGDDIVFWHSTSTTDGGGNLTKFNNCLTAGVWQHIFITYDGTGSVVKCYVNGVDITNKTQTGSIPATLPNNTGSVLMGQFLGLGRWMDGIMDENALWGNVVGTAQNAIDLYNSGNGALASDVIASPTAYWRMDESGTDQTAIDSSGNGNNGTLNNFPSSGMWVIHSPGGFYSSAEIPPNGDYYVGYSITTPTKTFFAYNDNQLIIVANYLGGTTTTAGEAKVYLAGRSNTFILNNAPTNIVTSGSVLNLESNNLSSYPTSGINAYDVSGGGNDGTLINGVGFNTNGYFEFDGTDERILLNDTLDTAFTTQYWTVDIWFNLNSTYAGYDAMLGNGFPFQLFVHAGKIKAYLSSTAGSANYFLSGMTSTQTISVDTWYHLSFVRNGTNYYYYINGALDKSATSSTDVCAAANQNAQIGNLWATNDAYTWKGDISNVKIYNREITTSEIKQNYYQAPIVTDGLVFALDAGNLASYENGDVTTHSLTGSQDGTLTNGVGYSNNNGGKWVFDGADDYIDFGSITSTDPLSLYGLNEFTIEFWVKANGIGDGSQRIIDKSNGVDGADGWAIWLGEPVSDNEINFVIDGVVVFANQPFTDYGNWVHYAITKNGNDYELWVDGELKQTTTNTTVIPSTTTNCRIGSWNHSTGRELNGEVSTVRIYNKTLTAGEVRGNFESQRNRFTKYSSPFKMTVTTTTINETFSLPFSSIGAYNCVVDWGDGSSSEIRVYNGVGLTHIYASSGDHQITISGQFGGLYFYSATTVMRNKVKSIDQWGTNPFKNMIYFFYGCGNMVSNAVDAPNLENVTSTQGMFLLCSDFNSDLSNWNMSNITISQGMFQNCSSFNGNIRNWDVSNITDMAGMFNACTNFNGDLRNWNVSSVENFAGIFQACTNFNGDLRSWDVSSATNISQMFVGCPNFNSIVSSWDVSNVINMSAIFRDATSFSGNISSWDVSNVTNMSQMFYQATSFNQDISSWDVSNVTRMEYMFWGNSVFNQSLSNWERSTVGDVSTVGNVTNMRSMFQNATSFNQDIGNWDVSNVSNFTDFMASKTPITFSSANLDAIYNGWSLLTLSPNEVISFGTATFTPAGAAGRLVLTSSPNNWTITDGGTPLTVATGGTITYSDDGYFKIHTFNASGVFNVIATGTDSTYGNNTEYLMVAGGGGGGEKTSGGGAGGGGAGGLLTSFTPLTSTPYTISVGAGGSLNASGVSTTFNSLTALGGGKGGGIISGTAGGSGGGAGGYTVQNYGGSGTVGQGNDGGDNVSIAGGGGGGAGAAGSDGDVGNGGVGLSSSISNILTWYAGGGGCGGAPFWSKPYGTGGNGGGGTGANFTPISGRDGVVNTGGGGGGSQGYNNPQDGGIGGSGIVIIKYKYQPFDEDAQAFITAAAITGLTQQTALDQLVLNLKGIGSTTNNSDVWSDLYALYPFSPIDGSTQTLTAYSYNLINTSAFQVTWNNTPTIDSIGVLFNGSNQYGNTNFDIDGDALSLLDFGLTINKISEVSAGNGSYMGAYDGANETAQLIEVSANEGGNIGALYTNNVSFGSFAIGVNTLVRRSDSDMEGYENGISIGSNTVTISTPSPTTALISLGGRSGAFLKNCKLGGGNAIHKGLTDNQAKDLRDAITTYNTALGR